jgi:hypothetical protein
MSSNTPFGYRLISPLANRLFIEPLAFRTLDLDDSAVVYDDLYESVLQSVQAFDNAFVPCFVD